MIKLLIYFRFSFNQGFLVLSDNLVTHAKFPGSWMKYETSEPDSPKIGNVSESSSEIVLNSLCNPLPMFNADNKNTFHYVHLCLMRLHILKRASLLFMLVWDWFPSWISSNISVDIGSVSNLSPDNITSIYTSLINVASVESSSY